MISGGHLSIVTGPINKAEVDKGILSNFQKERRVIESIFFMEGYSKGVFF